ncbi:unnamed protein product, partial [Lampetra planeri]
VQCDSSSTQDGTIVTTTSLWYCSPSSERFSFLSYPMAGLIALTSHRTVFISARKLTLSWPGLFGTT